MILAIDIGNTNIVIGCIEGERVCFAERVSTNLSNTELEYVVEFRTLFELYHIGMEEVTGSIISSVVPPVNNIIKAALEKLFHKTPLVVGPGLKTGLNILMDNPGQLGSDLVVNAVAGLQYYGAPIILIDMGTATTISVVDDKKNYIGGMILPGVKVSLDSLVNRTSQLPRISLEAPKKVIGRTREMLVKWEANDPEVRALWKKMNDWVYAGFDETYRMMGVTFDKIYYESNTYLEGKEKVMEGLEKGFFYRKEDGSVWADLTGEGLDHKLLLRADGTSVYMTQDIGTAKLRFADYPIDKMIYVVGNEQNYHFQVLSILLDKLGFEWGKGLVHFSYGMVELPEGKMKSREGTVVDADDLMAEMIDTAKETSNELGKLDGLTKEEADDIARIVGLGALKYFILKVDARKNMTFNPKESIDFNGNTGPFIQYTYARIQSVLRKAKEAGIEIPAQLPAGIELSEKEEGLIQMVADFAAIVKQAGEDYSPSIIANYTYDLVKEYNQFYHDFSILREENEAVKVFRLALSENVSKVVRLGMGLLGIEVPDRM